MTIATGYGNNCSVLTGGIICASVDSYELMMFYQLIPYAGFFQCVHGLTLVEAGAQLAKQLCIAQLNGGLRRQFRFVFLMMVYMTS